jgi:hypothetical protein
MSVATKRNEESLVKAAVDHDRIDRQFSTIVNRLTRTLKARPGGRRKWIFDQAVFGKYKPHRAIIEMIDLCVDAGSPEEDVEQLAQFFVQYINDKYAAKQVEDLSTVRDVLKLAITADTDEVKAEAQAIAEPESISALEQVIDATVRDTRSNENVLSICRRKLSHLTLAVR